jgi:chorismate mutase
MWNIPIELKNRIPSISMFCDPSHISGKRDLIFSISQQALDLGFDGLMIESHCNPDEAITDKAQQLEPENMCCILDKLVVRDNLDSSENMRVLRGQIDILDDELMHLLSKRFEVCKAIGKAKKEHNMPILQSSRFKEISEKRANQAELIGIDPKFVHDLFVSLQNEAIRLQLSI